MRVPILRGLMIAMFALTTSSGIVFAGALEGGRAAYNRGDYATALQLIEPLAAQGNATAQTLLGFMYANGQGVPKDDKEAFKWFRLGAEQGDTYAGSNLGFMYLKGRGVPKDDKEAFRWFRLSAEQGNALAQSNLGSMYSKGQGVPQDYDEAIKWYRLAAALGNALAQSNLGEMYENGWGVPKGYDEAVKWYRLAAAQGNAAAQGHLGRMYDNGFGVTNDLDEAIKWYRLAAEQGNASAQANLGSLYIYGRGVPQDFDEAVKWWRLAAAQGSAIAQNSLGAAYQNGKGVPKDYDEAVKWYRLAAVQGYALAQSNLGLMYQSGQGAPQDNVLSYMWLTVAKANLADVAAKMSPAQIELAQKMAKRCEQSNYKQCGESQGDQFGDLVPTSVPMQIEGGIYVVPVLINEAITLDFVVDSGAADVSVPADVVMTLMRTRTLKETDFLGEKTYVLADGSKIPSQTFRIRSLKVGSKVLENVNGSVSSVKGNLLLGQSFLSRFKSWSVDNTKHALLLSE